ncbi:MAG TPA: alpha-amylase family glycosyl hydrolase [Bacteroidota bacterium]|nr:alpha-amylase family glycosyl hydrolase [Bacteroidota bacterium]
MKILSMRVVMFVALLMSTAAKAADSVDVTFYYTTKNNPTYVFLPGEFNNWGPNNSGVIASNAVSLMKKDSATGIWWKTVRLHVGGMVGGGVPGAYEYKINENGTSTGWLSDPMNPRQNLADNNNSILYVNSPTIEYLLPNSTSGIVGVQHPVISAHVFPSMGAQVDTETIQLWIDSASYQLSPSSYNQSTKLVSFKPASPLENGPHKIKLSVQPWGGAPVTDSATFTVVAGPIQILNQSGYTTVKDSISLYGSVEDVGILSAEIVRNGTDTQAVAIAAGKFTKTEGLTPGVNTFKAFTKDSTGATITSSQYIITRYVNPSPTAVISIVPGEGAVTLSSANSTDPDTAETASLTSVWSIDPANPEVVSGVDGSTQSTIPITVPKTPGEYYFGLIVSDAGGNKDTTRGYFIVNGDGSVTIPTAPSNPGWVKNGRIYEMFFNSFTSQQTINAAVPQLDYLQRLGVNILWIMPVMKNNGPIDNGPGPGYDIIDFYTVATQYGTNADFKNFVQQAHLRGIKVILDVTPNHTSQGHPFVQNARLYTTNSFYWPFYQHQLITNSNYHPELSEAITPDGFVYYGAFSDEILNYNWGDLDARAYMIGVFTWWVKQIGIDGYRFDVYWGPDSRANNGNGGENEMGQPVRSALKHAKPDVFILGEAPATGPGTEVIFGDRNGGVDAAYDWNLLHNVIQPFNISALNNNVTNYGGDTMGFVPGPNSRFMRFLENHDEDRIAYTYGSYAKTMPMGTLIFTVPGIPMIYSGQEVGFGLGIANFDQRRRGIIDWNSAGKSLLSPHYQRLAWIRSAFPAFWSLSMRVLPLAPAAGSNMMYAYARPFSDQNGIAVENFNNFSVSSSVTIKAAQLAFSHGWSNGKTYYLNDVYHDTAYEVSFYSDTMNLNINLPAYGSAVYILADSVLHLTVPALTSVQEGAKAPVPLAFSLSQNFPNPFNPTTLIQYSIPHTTKVSLKVYDVLGRVVATLVDERQNGGTYEVEFDGKTLSSGVYYYRLTANNSSDVKRMLLLK